MAEPKSNIATKFGERVRQFFAGERTSANADASMENASLTSSRDETQSSAAAIDYLLRELRDLKSKIVLPNGGAFLLFVYGFKEQEELPYYTYLAIRTAQACNTDWPVVFCCVNEPSGIWWDEIKPTINVIKMPTFEYFLGARFYHYAHKADVVRLLMLRELGGVYLDMDTLSVRSFQDLTKHDFGMAVQASVHDAAAGLCNAVMWGKPNAEFVRIWIDEYRSFRSKGRDELWDYHSVKLPAILARTHYDKVTILNHRAFFYPLWTDLERIMLSEGGHRFLPHLKEAYGFHLWNGATEAALRKVSPEWIEASTSAYAYLVRQVLKIPENPSRTDTSGSAGPEMTKNVLPVSLIEPGKRSEELRNPMLPRGRMRKPLISIVMPTLNSERFIREAMNSIVEQTYENIELVVVDGGSTDHTLSIVSEYKAEGRLKIVHSTFGMGMGYDLNLGLAHAEGAFIARMDADDIAFDWRLDAQYRFLSQYPEVDLVGSGAELFWDASGECRSPLWSDHIRDMYLVNNPFFHPTVMFRRQLVDSGLMRYDEAFKSDEDYELWGRVIRAVKTANMDCSAIKYRIHKSNNQRNPSQRTHKAIALERFCKAEGIYDPSLLNALVEFQASGFVTPETYDILSKYARLAVAQDEKSSVPWPKLGWIQWAMAEKSNYAQFMEWYTKEKGWRLGG